MTWWGNWGLTVDHELFSNNLIRLHCTLSNLWAPIFNWEKINWKRIHGAQIPIVRLIFQRLCDDNQCLFVCLFVCFFFHLLRLMGIYRVGPRPGIEKFRSLFSFLPFIFIFFSSFSFLFLFFLSFFFFFLSLSLGGPFSSGAPGHCPPMPPSRYATVTDWEKTRQDFVSWCKLHPHLYVLHGTRTCLWCQQVLM